MIGKAITALVLAAALAGCSTFSDSKMTKMDQRDADDALKVPKYMLTALRAEYVPLLHRPAKGAVRTQPLQALLRQRPHVLLV